MSLLDARSFTKKLENCNYEGRLLDDEDSIIHLSGCLEGESMAISIISDKANIYLLIFLTSQIHYFKENCVGQLLPQYLPCRQKWKSSNVQFESCMSFNPSDWGKSR